MAGALAAPVAGAAAVVALPAGGGGPEEEVAGVAPGVVDLTDGVCVLLTMATAELFTATPTAGEVETAAVVVGTGVAVDTKGGAVAAFFGCATCA